MLKEIKTKAKETAVEVKDFVVDNKGLIAFYGVMACGMIACAVYGKHTSKKYDTLWHKAKEQLDNGQIKQDFGPYKIARFFEPTGEFMGEIPMHEKSTEAFLNLK